MTKIVHVKENEIQVTKHVLDIPNYIWFTGVITDGEGRWPGLFYKLPKTIARYEAMDNDEVYSGWFSLEGNSRLVVSGYQEVDVTLKY